MKRRHRQLLNLLSIGLLLVALYLNFIKKETDDASIPVNKSASIGATSQVKQEGTFVLMKPAETVVLE